jgi:hypothetical protein
VLDSITQPNEHSSRHRCSTGIGREFLTSDKIDFLVSSTMISVMARQFLPIPAVSATAERMFSFAGLTPLRPAQISP